MNDRYRQAAEEMDALKDTGREMEGLGDPVPARVKKNADSVFSLRLSKDDLKELQEAAQRKGLKVSEVIRRGALEYARRDEDEPRALANVREKVRELNEAVSRL